MRALLAARRRLTVETSDDTVGRDRDRSAQSGLEHPLELVRVGQLDRLTVIAAKRQSRRHIQAVLDHRPVLVGGGFLNKRLRPARVLRPVPHVVVGRVVLGGVLLQLESQDSQGHGDLNGLFEAVVPDGHASLV